MFLIPGVASLVLFALTWWADLLPRPRIVGGLVLLGVGVQWLAPVYSVAWLAGLLLSVCTGIYLAIQLKLGS